MSSQAQVTKYYCISIFMWRKSLLKLTENISNFYFYWFFEFLNFYLIWHFFITSHRKNPPASRFTAPVRGRYFHWCFGSSESCCSPSFSTSWSSSPPCPTLSSLSSSARWGSDVRGHLRLNFGRRTKLCPLEFENLVFVSSCLKDPVGMTETLR